MTQPTPDAPEEEELPEDEVPACVMVFNASDPSGAGGLAADAVTVASVGGLSPVQSGSSQRQSVLWLPTSSVVWGSSSSRNASR